MINIIKSQVYKLIHYKVILIAFIASCALSGFTITELLDIENVKITGSLFAVNNAALPMAIIIFLGIVVTIIESSDFIDKTINYEILSGHKKKEIYFGRFIVALIVGIVGSIIVMNIISIIFTVFNGWGDCVIINKYIIRNSFACIIILKIICFITMVCFLARNSFASWGILFAIFYLEFIMNIMEIVPNKLQLLLTMPQLTNIFLFPSNAVSSSIIQQSILASVVEGFICLCVGYICFIKCDMQ